MRGTAFVRRVLITYVHEFISTSAISNDDLIFFYCDFSSIYYFILLSSSLRFLFLIIL